MTDKTENEVACPGAGKCGFEDCDHYGIHEPTIECDMPGTMSDLRTGETMQCPKCGIASNKTGMIKLPPTRNRRYNLSWNVSVDLRGEEGEYRARVRQHGGARFSMVVQVPRDLGDMLGIEPGDECEITIRKVK